MTGRLAGYCSQCGANAWLRPDGWCEAGHPPTAISGIYEVGEEPPAPVTPTATVEPPAPVTPTTAPAPQPGAAYSPVPQSAMPGQVSVPQSAPIRSKSGKKVLLVAAIALAGILVVGGVAAALVLTSGPFKASRLITELAENGADTERIEGDLIALGEAAVPKLIEALETSADTNVRVSAVDCLGGIGSDEAIDALIATAGDRNGSVGRAVQEALIAIGEPALDKVAAAADSAPSADARLRLTIVLAEAGDDRAYDALDSLLSDPDARIRAQVVRGLGLVGDDRAYDLVVEAFQDPDAGVRLAVVELLADWPGPETGATLASGLSDSDTDVALTCVDALAAQGDAAALNALVHAVSSGSSDVEIAAAEALAVCGDDTCIKGLIGALGTCTADSYDSVVAALASLKQYSIPQLVAALQSPNADISWGAQSALAGIGVDAIQPLCTAANSTDYMTRLKAARALLALHEENPDAMANIIGWLNNKDYQKVAGIYPFYIMLGQEGSEPILAEALKKYGNVTMGEDYLNCGNAALDAAARSWASAHGYTVVSGGGNPNGPQWGD